MADRKHLPFVLADQLEASALGRMGHPEIRTPNLDTLAAGGTLFRDAYVEFPVCTRYRGVLMTGRYGAQTGITQFATGPSEAPAVSPTSSTITASGPAMSRSGTCTSSPTCSPQPSHSPSLVMITTEARLSTAPSPDLPGGSLVSMIDGGMDGDHHPVFAEHAGPRNWAMIRDGDWKYVAEDLRE